MHKELALKKNTVTVARSDGLRKVMTQPYNRVKMPSTTVLTILCLLTSPVLCEPVTDTAGYKQGQTTQYLMNETYATSEAIVTEIFGFKTKSDQEYTTVSTWKPDTHLDASPTDLNLPENDKTESADDCPFNICDILNLCSDGQICVTTPAPDCHSHCVDKSVSGVFTPGSKNLQEHTTMSTSTFPIHLRNEDLQLPDLDVPTDDCPFSACDMIKKLCREGEICITTPAPDCISHCVNKSLNSNKPDTTTTLQATDTTSLRPLSERRCSFWDPSLECYHGIPENCSQDEFSCLCDDKWDGTFCSELCNLSCNHGECHINGNGQRFCTCQKNYMGKFCDKRRPDPEENGRILAAVLSVALVFVIALAIIIPIILWHLRVIFILQLVYHFKEYEDEDGKTYDAYVSMTPTLNAENFVYKSMLPALEDQGFKIYLQARDSPAGEAISETILSAVEKSRRTIMVVTCDYITNEWNRFEYMIAQHETLKLKQRIIPIILEDISKEHIHMDKSLKHILDSLKCLKYPQPKQRTSISDAYELSENIQSPDSNISVNSTTEFFPNGKPIRGQFVSKEQQKYEKKISKFWKQLELTMPKKKTKEESAKHSNLFLIFGKNAKYDMQEKTTKPVVENLNSIFRIEAEAGK